MIGEYKKSVSRSFKLPVYAAGFELLPEAFAIALAGKSPDYVPLSRYPSSERDICFQVERAVTYQQIIEAAQTILESIDISSTIEPIDVYAPADGVTKNITIRLKFTATERTLTGDEVTDFVTRVAAEVAAKTDAKIV